MLRVLVVVSSLVCLLHGLALREKRNNDNCESTFELFQACTTRAYDDYRTEFSAGDDGDPNWLARKSCNYLTAAVEDCANSLLGDCYDENTVTEMKDAQFSSALDQLGQAVEEWDSELCPAVRQHVERQNKAGDETNDQPDHDPDDADDDDDADDADDLDLEGDLSSPLPEAEESAGVCAAVSGVLITVVLSLI